MKTKNIFLSLTTLVMLLFTACNSEEQNTKQTSTSTSNADVSIEVIQFHSEHRCMTCNKIEELTRETLKGYSDIPFSLVNVDDKKNEKKAEEFEAAGTALFLYNPKTGKKKDLTDFAFMNAGDKEKFTEGLKMEIEQFEN
ncbi:MAG: nitrophenyl compound nitroreductase subunit ArsF family protein [Crocinitomicaceae bacterium]